MTGRRQYDSRREGSSSRRRRGRDEEEEGEDGGDGGNHNNRRDRSRSRSPPQKAAKKSENEDFEEERRARMARLRQEMQEEDQELAALDQPETQDPKVQPQKEIIEVNPEELEGMDEEEQMRMLLGFSGGFGSTKGAAVEDNQNSAARGAAAKNKARKYRQYMNRKNGFNRPLDKMD
jgi:U4/U6.U5 tri-snRNP-associated protein 3